MLKQIIPISHDYKFSVSVWFKKVNYGAKAGVTLKIYYIDITSINPVRLICIPTN